MAELGSHELDPCSIFLGKVKPLVITLSTLLPCPAMRMIMGSVRGTLFSAYREGYLWQA
jgi:hypothetical protein